MVVEVLIEDPRWEAEGISALAQRAIDAVLAHIGLDALHSDVSILACDDARITVLNADFRDKLTPTNVLSWPAEDLAPGVAGARPRSPEPDPDGMIELGDVAISYDTCAAEAADQNKPFSAHVTHLLVHGLLHLLGYDHIRDLDATLMEGIEIEILGKMGVDNPYRIG